MKILRIDFSNAVPINFKADIEVAKNHCGQNKYCNKSAINRSDLSALKHLHNNWKISFKK